MDWQDREEQLRRLLVVRREYHQRRRVLAETRIAYKTAQRQLKAAEERVERVLSEIESRQGFLPFTDSGSGAAAAQQQPAGNGA